MAYGIPSISNRRPIKRKPGNSHSVANQRGSYRVGSMTVSITAGPDQILGTEDDEVIITKTEPEALETTCEVLSETTCEVIDVPAKKITLANNKTELIAYATELGIEVNDLMTKKQIFALIESAK